MPPRWWDDILELVPSSRSAEVPEAGHCSHISMPGTFNQTVLEWIREIDATGVVGLPGRSPGQSPGQSRGEAP